MFATMEGFGDAPHTERHSSSDSSQDSSFIEERPARTLARPQLGQPQDEKTQGGKKKEKETTVIAEFHAVYCLVSRCQNKAHKGRCYIGYTKDTNRRIKQHNGGKDVGGAKKTDGRGPWDMVFCVEGFPNQVSGLRFEWASQNPDKSRVLKDRAIKKEKKETPLAFRWVPQYGDNELNVKRLQKSESDCIILTR
ncbi:hypothetical protein PRIPAC_89373 [Pristionchus pacificus]|uniref:GIY-YIG domain-containing protein n=1 Tax=Pristionchus pacificus TaxID=54126 RepID=A0A2A6CXJ6_PRIPA|nr:hypothetical protein PRIPAC_89373 [Pristionchus pacificus]|eukprot:PDM82942.1 hypothetical protein PRIPAC_37335 [Pristionchus pacificus]